MNEFLSTLLQAVLIAAIPIISAFIGKGVKAFANHLSAQTDNELAKKYLKEAADAIEEAVAFTNQTYVDTLKKSGTFTKENQEEKSLDKAVALLTAEARKFLEEAYGDLNSYLLNRIEPEVRRQKNGEPATLSVPLEAVEGVRESPDVTSVAAATAAATAAVVIQNAIPQVASAQASDSSQEGAGATVM